MKKVTFYFLLFRKSTLGEFYFIQERIIEMAIINFNYDYDFLDMF